MSELEQGVALATGGSITLEWAAASRAKIAGEESGDGTLVRVDSQKVLLAVADGAGHGAAAAAARATCLEALARGDITDLKHLFERAHQACRSTRGAALGLAAIDLADRSLVWAAIGEIGGILHQHRSLSTSAHGIIQKGGALGHQLPSAILQQHKLLQGDQITLFSDGVKANFDQPYGGHSAASAARRILDCYASPNDDALALVAYCRAA